MWTTSEMVNADWTTKYFNEALFGMLKQKKKEDANTLTQ
jgi:hypothetical protein